MKVLVIGDPHGFYQYDKSILRNADIIFVTGDIGKADLARKLAFRKIERKREGLSEIKETPKEIRDSSFQIYNSSIRLARSLSKFAPTYSILGNVWPNDSFVKKQEQKYKVKLPRTILDMKKIPNFYPIKNSFRNINGLRVGFLEYFVDNSWIKEFNESDKRRITIAKKETERAKKILKSFKKLDILLCHQPPYGILDKVSFKGAPKSWIGKHAGSKVILDYIKKEKPRYVFCGHIHEAKGKRKIGGTWIYNIGAMGDYLFLEIK